MPLYKGTLASSSRSVHIQSHLQRKQSYAKRVKRGREGERVDEATSVVYYITHNPHAYEVLVKEIREAFSNEEDITFAEVAKLKYLQAVINDTMRIHPSVPVGLPRIVPRGGRFIDGEFVPGGVSINFDVWG